MMNSTITRPLSNTIKNNFWEKALNSLPAELQHFLLQTSILGAFNAELCTTIIGLKNCTAIIEEILQRKLLIVEVKSKQTWYRYHHLFQIFLSSYLRKSIRNEFVLLHRRAATYWLACNEIEKALDHALTINAQDIIIHAFNSSHENPATQDNNLLYQRAIFSLNNETICQHPRIFKLACAYWMERNKSNLIQLLHCATATIHTISDETLQRHTLALIELYHAKIAYSEERINISIACAERAVEYLPSTDLHSQCEINLLFFEINMQSGNISTANKYLQHYEKCTQSLGVVPLLIELNRKKAMLAQNEGLLAHAQLIRHRAIICSKAHYDDSNPSLWRLYYEQAEIAWEYFNIAETTLYCQKALQACPSWSRDETAPILIIQARAQLLLGHQADAKGLLAQAENLLKKTPHHSYAHAYFNLALAEFHLSYSSSSELILFMNSLTLPIHFFNQGTQRQGRSLAICRLGSNDIEGAIALLEMMNIDAIHAQLITEKWRNDIWLTVCLQKLHKHDQAEITLETCLQRATEKNLVGSTLMATPFFEIS